MRAIVCRHYGPPEDLEVADFEDPQPGPGEVVVDVHAAAVNFPDVLHIANKYQVPIPLPFIPGGELSGVVTAAGAGVTGLQPGDKVFGATGTGAFAERVALPASRLETIPDAVGFPEAAAFSVTYRTAYHALRSVARVRTGDWVVVLGAAGGVGLAAIDVARALGAQVIAAASGPAKLDLAIERGAARGVDYASEDLKGRIREITGGGAHVVIDPVGGPFAEQALRALGWGGMFVTIGFASGAIPKIPLNLVLLKGVTIRGMDLRTFAEHHPDQESRDRAELLGLLAAGRVRPNIGARFPLTATAAALRHVADRHALGKVVIDVR
jgi:NADPH2:quinone reductase